MVCKQCGNSVKSDFKYCPYCGERMISDFHDQFHDLTPPFVIHDIPESEEDLYGEPPEESPVFDTVQEHRRGETSSEAEMKRPLDYDTPPQTHKRGQPFAEPEAAAYDRSHSYFVRPPEFDFDDSAQDYGGLEDAPYIVYDPDGGEEPLRSAQAGMSQKRRIVESPRTSAEKLPRIAAAQELPHSGMGIGLKLAAILVTLMLAGGISVIGYRLLTPDQSFSHPAEDGASFASVLCI